MSDMKPALTKRDWKNVQSMELTAALGAFREIVIDGAFVVVYDNDYYDGYTCRIERADGHKIAAVFLHEQEFGFTREDVNVVRGMAETTRHRTRYVGDVCSRLDDLADRIEALLPPEEP